MIKDKLIKAIDEVETEGAEFYPYMAVINEENVFKKLINKFYDNEQNIISHGGKNYHNFFKLLNT